MQEEYKKKGCGMKLHISKSKSLGLGVGEDFWKIANEMRFKSVPYLYTTNNLWLNGSHDEFLYIASYLLSFSTQTCSIILLSKRRN